MTTPIIGGTMVNEFSVQIGGVSADEILGMLEDDERRDALIINRADGSNAIINRYWNRNEWSWGYQANWLGGCESCGPFRTRWSAKRAAIKILREHSKRSST